MTNACMLTGAVKQARDHGRDTASCVAAAARSQIGLQAIWILTSPRFQPHCGQSDQSKKRDVLERKQAPEGALKVRHSRRPVRVLAS